ncbi:response regulator transcription factor [Actinoallomurus sp. NPDC050550]|uniref:response regulator n=1 Tax=Actinoallomurus sp. NPDC050550 TaxID=3154937 RepID=UPI0033DDC147
MTLRVLVADDHAMFRSGLRAVLDTQPDLACVGEASDGRTAVSDVLRLRPDVAIIDIRMPRLDGLRATEAILADPANTTKVILLTTYDCSTTRVPKTGRPVRTPSGAVTRRSPRSRTRTATAGRCRKSRNACQAGNAARIRAGS